MCSMSYSHLSTTGRATIDCESANRRLSTTVTEPARAMPWEATAMCDETTYGPARSMVQHLVHKAVDVQEAATEQVMPGA